MTLIFTFVKFSIAIRDDLLYFKIVQFEKTPANARAFDQTTGRDR